MSHTAVMYKTKGEQLKSSRLDHSLTVRERDVILLVSEGLSNKEIGRRLDIREGTVKTHLHNIYQKVGIANRTALAAFAITNDREVGPTPKAARAGR